MISETKYQTIHGEGMKILTPEEILQRLSIALAKLKAAKTFEMLLNEIIHIIYSLYQGNGITKKVCNNIMILVKL